jgi:hypothetical protein
MFKKSKKVYIVLIIMLVITILILGYFIFPKTFKTINLDQTSIIIIKYTEDISYNYHLNEEEVSDFVKILEKSKFYHGVFKPDSMYGDKLIDLRMIGGGNLSISIYYDTNKTYVFANISNKIILNDYYRISNKEEIRNFIENIIITRAYEFEKEPAN